jgi:hypothetical protein
MIDLPACYFEIYNGMLEISIPEQYRDIVFSRLKQLKNNQVRVTLKKPGRPRTTGAFSQSHCINGYCQQIATATGQDFDTVKMAMKRLAVSRGYPFRTEKFTGEIVPYSETEINTEQAAILIETIIQFASEYNIRLYNYES